MLRRVIIHTIVIPATSAPVNLKWWINYPDQQQMMKQSILSCSLDIGLKQNQDLYSSEDRSHLTMLYSELGVIIQPNLCQANWMF